MAGRVRALPLPPPKSFRERWAALGNLVPFFVLVWQASPGLTLAGAFLRIGRAIAPAAALWIGKLIIDDIVALAGKTAHPTDFASLLADPAHSRLLWLVAAEFAIGVTAEVMGRLGNFVDSLQMERISILSSSRLMRHAATLDLEDFENATFQDRLERARKQAAGNYALMGLLVTQLQMLLTIGAFLVVVFVYNPWLILLLVASQIPAFLGEGHFNAATYALDAVRATDRREIDYVRATASAAESAKEVKIFGLAGFLRERFELLSESFYAASRLIQLRRAMWGSAFAFFGSVGYYAAYGWIIVSAVKGQITIGDLVLISGSLLQLRRLIEQILLNFAGTAAQAMYVGDLFDFFETRPRITVHGQPLPVPEPIREGFVFENVGFRYPGSERWAVRGLSFALHAGETLALVGENGAGKTTLVKLIGRLYDPDEGRVLLDGRDLRDYDLDDLRAAIGVIFQDFVRYNLPARDNIAVGRIEARDDLPRIKASAEAAMASQAIERLPETYDQMIGKRFRDGYELSGGEWQKIAIARAYMRRAQVLILDEPTAALDARAEYEVFQRFKELSAGKTAVLISHRFSSVRMADRILVLADGHVEDQGTHEQLMARGGRYAELFELQAAGYR